MFYVRKFNVYLTNLTKLYDMERYYYLLLLLWFVINY